MIAALIGLALVVVAVVLWVGGLTVAHAVAILIGAIGVLLVLYWAAPTAVWVRRS